MIWYLRSTWWGADPLIFLNIYKSFIRSSLEYGLMSVLISNNQDIDHKLEVFQNQAIRLALGYRCTTPINVLIKESNCLNLKHKVYDLTNKYILKLLSQNNHPVLSTLKAFSQAFNSTSWSRPLMSSSSS